MAKTWTKTIGIGTYGARLRLRVMLLSQNKSANTSRVRTIVDANTGNNSGVHNQGSGANVSVSGTVSKTINGKKFSIGRNKWGTFLDETFTVKHDANGSKALSISGRLWSTGTSAFGNGGTVKVTATLPRLILAPTAPTWGSTSYVSASRIEITWTNRATARGPYSNLEVQRHNGSKWQSLITLGATGNKVGDPGFPKNSEVRYRVRAKGPGGTSGWVQGGTLGTTPAYPTNVHAVKSGQSIRVTWTDQAKATNRTRTFIIEDNPDGKGWTQVGTIGGSATSWTHENPDPAVTHQYKVATRITSGRDHQSAFSAHSNTVQLQAAPKRPTRQQPKDASTYEVGDELRFEWTHNPVDTTAQTAAELAWRIDGGDWHTEEVDSDDHVSVTPETDETRALLEWRVRTKGDHPDWSPWSTTNGPQLSTRPTAVIQQPEDGSDLDVSRMKVSWEYEANGDEDQLGQSQWRATLSRADADSGELGEVEQKSGDGTADDMQFDARLDNDTEYTVTVEVENGDGLWSEVDEATVTTDFPTPVLVDVLPRWDRSEGAVSLSFSEVESPDETDHAEADAIDVERRDPEGDWLLIASGIDTAEAIIDRTPQIGDVEYRAISRTTLPTERTGEVAVAEWVHDHDPFWVNGGSSMSDVCRGRGSEASDSYEVEQTTHQFAGRSRPTPFFGEATEREVTANGRILHVPDMHDVSTRDEWVDLLHQFGVVCFRDCRGRKVFGLLDISFDTKQNTETVQVKVTETEWEEGVQRVSDLDLEEQLGGGGEA